MRDLTSATVIRILKDCFARFGIPQKLITDNGRQFISEEFKDFIKNWQFKHVTSSPYHAQSNGLAERAVQTVKQLLKKCCHDKSDPLMALLQFRNTPRDNELASPAERLFSQKLRTKLPIDTALLKPKIQSDVTAQLKQRREKSADYTNRGRKPLRELQDGETIWMKDKGKWLPGRVCHKDVIYPRSYWVRVYGRNYRRNRYHLKPRNIEMLYNDESQNEAVPAQEDVVEQLSEDQPSKAVTAPKQKNRVPKSNAPDQGLAPERESRYGRAYRPVQHYQANHEPSHKRRRAT